MHTHQHHTALAVIPIPNSHENFPIQVYIVTHIYIFYIILKGKNDVMGNKSYMIKSFQEFSTCINTSTNHKEGVAQAENQ